LYDLTFVITVVIYFQLCRCSWNASRPAVECNPGQVVNTHMTLSPSSVIGTSQWAVMSCS